MVLARLPRMVIGVVAFGLAACTAGASPPRPDSPGAGSLSASPVGLPSGTASPVGSPQVDAEAVAFGSALAQIRGHHRVSLDLYENGDRSGAVTHATHPVAEILASLKGELSAHAAQASELETALTAGVTAAQGTSPDALRAAYGEAARATDEAETAALGKTASSAAYRGSVIADLVATAAHEYREAVADGKVELLVEYQDAYGFTAEARDLYSAISGDVALRAPAEAAEIQEAFGKLGVALPGPQPPATITAVEDVEAAAKLIGHELEETVGARPLEETDAAAEAHEIEELLDQIVAKVEAGARDEAAELAAEAYLEHYEVIEPEVIAKAPAVNAELEPLLGADLRRRITGGAAPDEIRTMVDRATALLRQAVEAVGRG